MSAVMQPAALIGIAWTLFQIYAVLFPAFPIVTQHALHVVFALAMVFAVSRPPQEEELAAGDGSQASAKPEPAFDGQGRIVRGVLLILCAVIGVYFVLEGPRLMARIPFVSRVPTGDILIGIALVLLVLEATRRTMGNALVVLGLIFIAYGFLGPHMPGLLAHRGLGLPRMIELLATSTQGILGTPVMVSFQYVFFFILFGALLEATGGGKLFIDLAIAVTGRLRSGPAQSAVVSSAFMGSINGSAVANVVSTGIFTIPLMKRRGYPPAFAGAVEAAASTGGQLMPPVMGAAAFILADTVGIPYRNVMIAAMIPSIVYYAAIGIRVHLEAVRQGMRAVAREDLPDLRNELKNRGHLLLPLVLLVYLIFRGLTPTTSALMATGFLWLISFLRPATRLTFAQTLEAFVSTSKQAVHVAIPCAAAGVIVGVVGFSNLGLKLSEIILALSSGFLPLLLILAAACAIVLGMGMPTTAAYIISSVLVAPAIVRLGVMPLPAHLFVFYFAILSMVTPPVALAAYAAAGLAKASASRVGWLAFQLCLPGFLLPFAFVYNPGILLIGPPGSIAWGTVTVLVGSLMLAASLGGFLSRELSQRMRAALFVCAVLVIIPEPVTSVVGLFVGGALIALETRAALTLAPGAAVRRP